jgi:putative ABC transport system permease protein
MALVQRDLVHQWQAQIPADAPDRFIINIQPDQADAVATQLRAAGVADVQLSPMIRGRLVSINGRPAESSRLEGERARALVEREFNLSYSDRPPDHNRIVEGHWFGAGADELSIEEGIAKTLGVHLGDRLCFDVAGEVVCAATTSVRSLSWDSMKVNFFIITAPQLLKEQAQTLITSIYVPPGAADPTSALVRRFRNLTVIDTTQVLAQVRGLLDRVTRAVQFVVLFAVGAGVLVLYTTVSGSQDEREREAALLRALGATRRRLWTLQCIELAAIGACAGALAGAGADAIGWWLARKALNFDFAPGWLAMAVGIAGGIACAVAGGSVALRRVVATPPMRVLREA